MFQTLIFSDSSVAGEGEHKIVQYIRSLPAEPADAEVVADGQPVVTAPIHVVVGADADLILLALASQRRNLVIMRERGFRPGEDYIHIHLLRQYLQHEMAQGLPADARGAVDGGRLIDDYILLSFLLGNDFLLSVPGLRQVVAGEDWKFGKGPC